jgi:hypothetical protein
MSGRLCVLCGLCEKQKPFSLARFARAHGGRRGEKLKKQSRRLVEEKVIITNKRDNNRDNYLKSYLQNASKIEYLG